MRAIAAADEGWGIGRAGGMLYELPGDLKYFARQTRGGVVIMGRATLRSLPGGRPLRDRVNIVLTRDRAFRAENALVLHDLGALAAAIAPYPPERVFVIGGQSVYEQLIDYCDGALITRVAARRPADRFFPDLDGRAGWMLSGCSPVQQEGGVSYAWCSYKNGAPLALPGQGLDERPV